MFGGFSQLPTTVERAVTKSNRCAQLRQHSRKLGRAAEHLNYRVRMLLKGAAQVYANSQELRQL